MVTTNPSSLRNLVLTFNAHRRDNTGKPNVDTTAKLTLGLELLAEVAEVEQAVAASETADASAAHEAAAAPREPAPHTKCWRDPRAAPPCSFTIAFERSVHPSEFFFEFCGPF